MPYRFFKRSSSAAIAALMGYSAGIGSMYLFNNTNNKRTKMTSFLFEPKKLKVDYDYLAPDTSEIRLLQTKKHAESGDMAHCRLPAMSTSIAIKHKTVEEIWYFTNGVGEIWLKEKNGSEHMMKVEKGMALTIPREASFQFRNISETELLEIVITTMPPWPGPAEAIQVQGKWKPSIKKEENKATYKKP